MKSNNKNKAVLWDMDGVIADTAPYHFRAWHKVFQERGVDFTEADFQHNFGQRNDTIIRDTLGPQVSVAEMEIISTGKEEEFRRQARSNLQSHAGSVELLQRLGEHGFRQALASSAPQENIEMIVKELGITDYFPVVVNGSDVTEGKPSPQVFLLAAAKLGVDPVSCIVIEDAIAGVTAAKRAGMCCIAVTNTHSEENLREADLIVGSLEGVVISDIENLSNRPC